MKMIPLTQGKFALVDDEDYEALIQISWFAVKKPRKNRDIWYAQTNIRVDGEKRRQVTKWMHQFIPTVSNASEVDHKNGDGLDNRRENLRPSTHSQNLQNRRKAPGSSKFKGVNWNCGHMKWHARIMLLGKHHFLGYFTDEQAAADAYDLAALRYFGEFALTNEQLNRA